MTDRDLLEVLTRLNTAITRFSMKLIERKGDREGHIGMALMLLDVADQILKCLLADDTS